MVTLEIATCITDLLMSNIDSYLYHFPYNVRMLFFNSMYPSYLMCFFCHAFQFYTLLKSHKTLLLSLYTVKSHLYLLIYVLFLLFFIFFPSCISLLLFRIISSENRKPFSISFSGQSAGGIFSVFVCLKISLFCFYF